MQILTQWQELLCNIARIPVPSLLIISNRFNFHRIQALNEGNDVWFDRLKKAQYFFERIALTLSLTKHEMEMSTMDKQARKMLGEEYVDEVLSAITKNSLN